VERQAHRARTGSEPRDRKCAQVHGGRAALRRPVFRPLFLLFFSLIACSDRKTRVCYGIWYPVSTGAAADHGYRDILYELASVGQLPLPKPAAPLPNESDHDFVESPSSQATAHIHLSASNAATSFAGGDDSSVGAGSGATAMDPSALLAHWPDEWFTPADPYAGVDGYGGVDPAQACRELDEMMSLIDSDTMAMWTNAPTGIEYVLSLQSSVATQLTCLR
jgi:hypothetical protein